ncbi:hypothetical protein JHK82_051624 [Glycine max]|nr:hypothetical protein JHK86_051462 [Glycine max]KAG4937407.1 hypothetical protein JHK85_052326 [Glycine max]KAG5092846.1 hypothetical protein JHK82_051624 [Glycine max]KAG5095911.1 hypothetical protein JHK84_051499 [Glycine max]
MMKFESGYSVEIVFDGSKLGIEPYAVEMLPNGELLILDSANSNIYRISSSLSLIKLRVQQCLAFHLELLNEAEVAAVAEEKETHSFEIDPSQHRAYGLADIQINELNARESLRIGWQGQGGVITSLPPPDEGPNLSYHCLEDQLALLGKLVRDKKLRDDYTSASPPFQHLMELFEKITCFIVSMFVICLLTSSVSEGSDDIFTSTEKTQNWLNHGGDIYNRRYASMEHKISVETFSNLSLKWEFYAGKDITATPAIFDGTLYFPCWNGNIFAVRAKYGSLVWKQNLGNLTGLSATGFVAGVNWTVARATPTIAEDDLLIVGIYGPAVVIAVKRSTGDLVWETRLDSHNSSVVTMSRTYLRGFSKLDIESGAILWQTYTIPDNHGEKGEYSGAAVWGSSPPIDASRNHIYIATGNLYTAPLDILECQEKENNVTQPTHPDDPDADFGEAPMMLTIDVNGTKQDVVVAVQKSGFAWALHRDDGKLIWSTNFTLRPSKNTTTSGGWVAMEACSGKILWSTANPSNAKANGPVTVANGIVFAGSTHQKGPIYAINGETGKIVW